MEYYWRTLSRQGWISLLGTLHHCNPNGEFNGELGTKHHLVAPFPSLMSSGIEHCRWIKQLMRACEEGGCWIGLTFGNKDGMVMSMVEYKNDVLHFS
jgi:hypothetical protein